jgi:hypothetical protein
VRQLQAGHAVVGGQVRKLELVGGGPLVAAAAPVVAEQAWSAIRR